MPDLHISLDGRQHVTAQLYRQIRDAVMDGRLRPGEPLPSSRELARRLEVSRNTIVVIYERLRAEGFLAATIGAGTFVSDTVRPRTTIASGESPLRARPLWDGVSDSPDMSELRVEYDFRPGLPDVEGFPFGAWRARMAKAFRREHVGMGAHIGPAGHPELRTAVARHVGVSRGVRAAEADVFITSGSQQAIDIIARVLLEPRDLVAVEDPGYPLPRRAFFAHGCTVTGVPVDAEGIVVDAIPADARLVYVTPSHQYPLGMPMSMARRQRLLERARRTGTAIIEDDYDSEFRYGGRPLETLHSLDGGAHVVYVGSFSKVMLPTLRLGFAVVPAPLHAAFGRAKTVTDWHTSVPLQRAAAALIDEGVLAQHVRRMRREYAARHDLIVEILERDFAGRLSAIPTAGGLHLSAFLNDAAADADVAVVERALSRGVAMLPLSYHYATSQRRAGFVIGYGAITTERIEDGLRRVRDCI